MVATERALDSAVDAAIGEKVHMLIWRQRRSQLEIARELGITDSVLSKKLRGDSAWSARQVHRVAKVFGVTAGSLFGEEVFTDTDPTSPSIVRHQGLEPRTR